MGGAQLTARYQFLNSEFRHWTDREGSTTNFVTKGGAKTGENICEPYLPCQMVLYRAALNRECSLTVSPLPLLICPLPNTQ